MDNYRLTFAERQEVVLNTNIVDLLKLANFTTQYNKIYMPCRNKACNE